MKRLIKRAFSRAGIYYAKRQCMPCGIDWLWDIRRVARGLPVRTVFDVGANVGQTTRLIKERFADADVHAFEPVSATYQSLERAVAQLEGVTCHRMALSDRVGRVAMTSEANSPLNRIVPIGCESGLAPDRLEDVETETIDRFCRARQIERLDILKVDAEGADLKVLQGAERMLHEGRVAFVFAEVGFNASDQGHVHVVALLEQLIGAGMEPYSFYDYCRLRPPSYEEEGFGLVFANVLFLNPLAISRLR